MVPSSAEKRRLVSLHKVLASTLRTLVRLMLPLPRWLASESFLPLLLQTTTRSFAIMLSQLFFMLSSRTRYTSNRSKVSPRWTHLLCTLHFGLFMDYASHPMNSTAYSGRSLRILDSSDVKLIMLSSLAVLYHCLIHLFLCR